MSCKPILFNTQMVQAILDGRKTVTRRIIKPQTVTHNTANGPVEESLDAFMAQNEKDAKLLAAACAPYQPGDILWVRETWMPCASIDSFLTDTNLYVYKADYDDGDIPGKWRPSIHMPKEAARLFLRVTDVRTERVNEISNTDCIREGINNECCRVCVHTGGSGCGHCNALWRQFRDLWDSLNAKRGYGWDDNPWVWVYTFERVDKPAGWPGGEEA